MSDRDFKGVWIPKEIYLSKELSWTEKILLTEIDSLDKNNEGCFASNEYLGEFLGISEGRCANIISKLRKKGIIIDKGFNGRKRKIGVKADFTKTLSQGSRKSEGRLNENVNIVIKNNNTDSNILSESKNNSDCKQEDLSLDQQKKKKRKVAQKEKKNGVQQSLETGDKSLAEKVFDHWNTLNVITHRKYPAPKYGKQKYETVLRNVLKEYSKKELAAAMKNYATIVNSKDYLFSYKWTLTEFLAKGVERFVDWEVASANKIQKNGNGKPEIKSTEYADDEATKKMLREKLNLNGNKITGSF